MTKTLGIIGAGRVGTTVGRLAIAGGWDVLMVGTARQTSLQLIVDVLVPGAVVTTAEDVADRADVVLVVAPFGKAGTVTWDAFGGKIVIDAMNYWSPVDGHLADVDADPRSTAEIHAASNPDVLLVKTLNHLGYHELEDDSLPAGDPQRRALAYATDHAAAKPVVAGLIDDLGFDPVDIGPLSEGRWLEPGHLVFGRDLNISQLRSAIERSRAAAD